MNAPSRLAFSPAKWIGIRSCHFVNEAPVSLMAILSIARRAVRPFAYSALTEPRKEGTVSPFFDVLLQLAR
jgi:hypothetical protein